MIKRFLTIILFLSLSLFLVMPVSAVVEFTKQTGIETETLDYRNSLIDWNGYNVDIDIIWDQNSGNLPDGNVYLGLYDSGWVFYLSTWECDAEYKCYLQMTKEQETYIKEIIFSRTYNGSRYITIYTDLQHDGYFLGFRLKFKSLLNINFKAAYIADLYQAHAHGNEVQSWVKSITFEDSDNLAMAGIDLDYETTQAQWTVQKALYTFNNKYTNISAIYLNYWNTKATVLYNSTIYNSIYQIGLFADNGVILPDLNIDTDFQIYAPTICGVLDIACVSRNLIGEFSNNIYKQLGAETIAGGVMVIYDTLFYPVYIVDDTGWQNGILSLYAMLVVGVLYLIVKRVLS